MNRYQLLIKRFSHDAELWALCYHVLPPGIRQKAELQISLVCTAMSLVKGVAPVMLDKALAEKP